MMEIMKWFWAIAGVIIVAIIVVILINLPKEDNSSHPSGNSEQVSQAREVKYPPDYWQTRDPNREISFRIRRNRWLDEPIQIKGSSYFWFEFSNKQIADDRAFVRCSPKKENLHTAKVRIGHLNGNKYLFGSVTSCRYFDFKLPPDSSLEREPEAIAKITEY